MAWTTWTMTKSSTAGTTIDDDEQQERHGDQPPRRTQALGAARDAPAGDPPQRLADDAAAHLAGAVLALDERDRHLDDPEARP